MGRQPVGKNLPVYDPASEEVIAQVPEANAGDVNRAVAAARVAFDEGPWQTTTAQERGRVLFRLADKIRQNLPLLAELEARNSASPSLRRNTTSTIPRPALSTTADSQRKSWAT